MTNISEIKAKMKSFAAQIAACKDPVARARLEAHFSRLMTELRKRERMRTQKSAGNAKCVRGPGATKKPKKVSACSFRPEDVQASSEPEPVSCVADP